MLITIIPIRRNKHFIEQNLDENSPRFILISSVSKNIAFWSQYLTHMLMIENCYRDCDKGRDIDIEMGAGIFLNNKFFYLVLHLV